MSMDSNREFTADREFPPGRVTLRRLIEQLPPQERRILVQRRHGGRTQPEVGTSPTLSRTLGWLRAAMLSDQPPPWPSTEVEAEPIITVRTGPPGVICVQVAGEVDRDNAHRLRGTLLEVVHRAAPRLLVEVDLGAVPLLDAAGIATLLAVHQAARARDVELTLVRLQPFVHRIALVGGLGPLLRADGPAGTEAP